MLLLLGNDLSLSPVSTFRIIQINTDTKNYQSPGPRLVPKDTAVNKRKFPPSQSLQSSVVLTDKESTT